MIELTINKDTTIGITGHRPDKLPWGYNEELPSCIHFKKDLKTMLQKAIDAGFYHYMSGMALGVDMIFAETIIDLKKKNKQVTLEGVIPCPNQDAPWKNDNAKKRYRKLLKQCDKTTLVSDHYYPACMNIRNQYIVDHSAVIIAVWNGEPSGTGNTVQMAKRKGCKIRIINPNDYKDEK